MEISQIQKEDTLEIKITGDLDASSAIEVEKVLYITTDDTINNTNIFLKMSILKI